MSDCIGIACKIDVDCGEASTCSGGNVDGGTVNVSTSSPNGGLTEWANVLIGVAGVVVAILALVGYKCYCRERCRINQPTSSGGATTVDDETPAPRWVEEV